MPNYQGQLLHETFQYVFEEVENKILLHPHEEIDLAALDFTPIHRTAFDSQKTIFATNADQHCIQTDHWLGNNLSMVEEVIMPGYPLAIFDDVNNYPIFRRGATASHPSVDFKNKPMGAVDIACHPGSSGSPIYIINETGARHPKSGIVVGAAKPILLGVLTEGAVYSSGQVKMVKLPTDAENGLAGLPINLGYYVKAKEVQFLGEQAVGRFEGHGPVYPRNRKEASELPIKLDCQ
ncbi:MAG: hypothetical protein C0473_04500 [Cyanobacteria bacterium DS3.002]|nr:hypothetical protein [Cyanobacteria bacterium DS3.002]MBA4077821.1 hypothetical protein [Cyanobacteria bacterium PR.023]